MSLHDFTSSTICFVFWDWVVYSCIKKKDTSQSFTFVLHFFDRFSFSAWLLVHMSSLACQCLKSGMLTIDSHHHRRKTWHLEPEHRLQSHQPLSTVENLQASSWSCSGQRGKGLSDANLIPSWKPRRLAWAPTLILNFHWTQSFHQIFSDSCWSVFEMFFIITIFFGAVGSFSPITGRAAPRSLSPAVASGPGPPRPGPRRPGPWRRRRRGAGRQRRRSWRWRAPAAGGPVASTPGGSWTYWWSTVTECNQIEDGGFWLVVVGFCFHSFQLAILT